MSVPPLPLHKNCLLVRVRHIGNVSFVFGVSVQLVQRLRREGSSFHCTCAEGEEGKLADGQKTPVAKSEREASAL